MLVPGSLGEGDEDLRSQTGGSTVHSICAEPADRRGGELAVPGVGSQSQATGHQLQAFHQHDADDETCTTAGGDVQEPRPGALLSIPSDQSRCPDLPMATPALPKSGPGMGAPEQALTQQHVDPTGNHAQTTCLEPMRSCGYDPAHHGTSAETWEGQRQA